MGRGGEGYGRPELSENPHPPAVECLLEALTQPAIAREAAVRLARIASIDVDLPSRPTPAQIENARERLAAWWKGVEPRYAAWQLE